MDVSSFPGKVDELAGKHITKLVLIYDRSVMRSQRTVGTYITDFSLVTTEMPLYVFVYTQLDLVAKYFFNSVYKSNKTWTISVSGHKDVLFPILRKALPLNGLKNYMIRYPDMIMCKQNIKSAQIAYKDIHIFCYLSMEPPKVDEGHVMSGKNEKEFLFNIESIKTVQFFCEGHYKNYLNRARIKWIMSRSP